MTNQQMNEIIKAVVTIKKELIGIKAWKAIPEGIPKYEGKAFPGMCGQIGEVLTTGETFVTDLRNQLCTGGVVATGVARPPSGKASIKIAKMHLELMKDYGNLDTALCYEDEMKKLIPRCEEKNTVVQVGRFREMKEADLVLIFCTPGVADLINRAYSYVTGKPIQGFGGNGGCPFVIQYPFVTRKPSFTYSDISWRKFVGLTDDELTMCFPFQGLVGFIESLPSVAENYRKFGEGMKL
jgi:uncharacterized protein (DUF169 family)